MTTFNKDTDTIAITVPAFTFKKGAANILFEDITDLNYSEPYFVTLAIDSHNFSQKALNFNFTEFPNIRRGGTVEMLGDGHLVYGPKNPGDFVAVSVLLMEASRDSKDLGEKVAAIAKSDVVNSAISSAVTTGDLSMSAVLKLMHELSKLVGERLQKSNDTYLFRTEGVFFKDTSVPYSVNRQFTSGNEFADLTVKVIPLQKPNKQGPVPQEINL
jgi:hypothetical protein